MSCRSVRRNRATLRAHNRRLVKPARGSSMTNVATRYAHVLADLAKAGVSVTV